MEITMKKVGIFTTFYSIDPGYSLCAVVLDQLRGLVKNGYEPVLFVLPSFNDEDKVPKGVEIRKVIPQIILEPYKGLEYPDKIDEDVDKVKNMLLKNMADIDELIVHDVFFIDSYLPYNIALRESSQSLKLRIWAWTHSAPSTRPVIEDNPHANRFNLPPKTKLVYLNHDKANDLAEMYGTFLKEVRVIPNSRDPRSFWGLDPFVVKLIDKYDILSSDITTVYPLSTPRMMSGKGLDKVIKIHGKLQGLGYKTRLVVCNAHANADRDKTAIANAQIYSIEQGMESGTLVFTSSEGEEYESGVDQKIVSDLFRISNVFIFPTVSENSSLVLLEAMLSGNLLVLNKKVGTLLEHAKESALYFDFDYRDKKEENERYYEDLAKIIGSQFDSNKSLQAKRIALQSHNYDSVFKNIEKLFYEE